MSMSPVTRAEMCSSSCCLAGAGVKGYCRLGFRLSAFKVLSRHGEAAFIGGLPAITLRIMFGNVVFVFVFVGWNEALNPIRDIYLLKWTSQ